MVKGNLECDGFNQLLEMVFGNGVDGYLAGARCDQLEISIGRVG